MASAEMKMPQKGCVWKVRSGTLMARLCDGLSGVPVSKSPSLLGLWRIQSSL